MGASELQQAINDLRARIRPENLPYLEAVANAAGCVLFENERLLRVATDGARAVIAVENQLLSELVGHRVDHSAYVPG